MSLTAAASGLVVLLLTVPVVQSQNGWGVTYTSTEICALKGSTVDINCDYKYPFKINDLYTKVEQTFWFTKESNNVYVDLRSDPEYSGRVTYSCQNKRCTLRIKDLRESDSAEYKFRFITNQPGGTYYGSPGVTLSVTDLQVQVSRFQVYESYNWAELKCHSRCRLPGHLFYIWNMNGQNIRGQTSYQNSYSASFYPADRVSCALQGYEKFPSPSVVVQSQNGWGVTYTSTEICAFKGSTVDISCTYRYPSRINDDATQTKIWFTRKRNDQHEDLKTDAGRMEYQCVNNHCTLRIGDLRESDSAEYKFNFNISTETFTGLPGVTLSVTDPQLQVHVRRSTVNQYSNWTELTCHSKCRLPDRPSYIWYKNGKDFQENKVYFHLHHPFDPADRYSCAVSGYEQFPSPSVYAPKLPSVSVSPSAEIVQGSSVTLTCSSDANPAANYTWYKENKSPDHGSLSEEQQLALSSIQSSDYGKYYCAAENELGRRISEHVFINVKYAPKLPSVSVSPSGDLVEGSPVTLTCSSDANPAANYTWYKENQTLHQGQEGNYYFTSISSEDRGIYYCMSENRYGRINSSSLSLNIQYAPKLPSMTVSPSGEIQEGRSVTLTCSSDANPAANYTWYKENKSPGSLSEEPQLVFRSIQSSDSGEYYCAAENQLERRTSEHIFINVKYAPKLPSVSVSPSAEVFQGSSVTLTCSSDANPEANYTWYKENEDSPKASGKMFTITDIRAEHGGNYYCEAQNRKGRHNSTLHLTVVAVFPGLWKLAVFGTTPALLLAIIWFSVLLLIKKKRSSKQSSEPGDRPDNSEQDDLHYASFHFSNNQTDPVYSNIIPVVPRRHKEEEEEELVEYTAIKFNSASTDPRVRSQETVEDPAALYSTVNKTAERNRNV